MAGRLRLIKFMQVSIVHAGEYSVKAYQGVLGLILRVQNGTIRFWINSNGYGDLRFWIDDEEVAGSWSDDSSWHEVSIPVNEGLHTFTWESYDEDDPYWLDDIRLPSIIWDIHPRLIVEDFETCDFSQLPWRTNADIDYSDIHSGECAAEMDAGEFLEVTLTLDPGNVNFFMNLEESGNELRFLIDGEEVGRWGYPQEWEEPTFFVEEGTHTFRWENSGHECCVEIDDILFPPSLPPI